jgi:hypothetical protein
VTVDPDTAGNSPTKQVSTACGTSISSPFVAGVVALMKALNPNLLPADVLSTLQATALDKTDPQIPKGYVNALGAVMAVAPNQAPTIAITSPTAGFTIPWNNPVNLVASISDPDQGQSVDDVKVNWVSDLQGPLCGGTKTTIGNNCDTPGLKPGHHVITATVTDPFGSAASSTIALDAISVTPTLQILSPANGASFYSSQQIKLRASATSPSETIPSSSFSWTAGGPSIATGSDTAATLAPGTYPLTVKVTDSLAKTATQTIKINVVAGDGYPTAVISSPKAGAGVPYQEPVTLVGSGTDPVDGILADANLRWSTSADGFVGTGRTLTFTPTSGRCAMSEETITLTVTNSIGKTATDSIKILAGSVC